MAFHPNPGGWIDGLGELLGAGIVMLLAAALVLALPLFLAHRRLGPATYRATRAGAIWGAVTVVAAIEGLWLLTHLVGGFLPEGVRLEDLWLVFYGLLWTGLVGGVLVAWKRAGSAAVPGSRARWARWIATLSVVAFIALIYVRVEFVSSCWVGRSPLIPYQCN